MFGPFLFSDGLFRAGVIPQRLVSDAIPDLRPPRGLIPASSWFPHGWVLIGLVPLIAGLVWWWVRRRQKAVAPLALPPAIVARQSLELLRDRAEDALLAVEVSHIVRRFVVTSLKLPPGELTTPELWAAIQSSADSGRRATVPTRFPQSHFQCSAVAREDRAQVPVYRSPVSSPPVAPEDAWVGWVAGFRDFLRECDACKFAPVASESSPDLVTRAIRLMTQFASCHEPAAVPPPINETQSGA